MKTVELIFTFEEKEQQFAEIEIPIIEMRTEQSMKEKVTSILTDSEKSELIKVSFCLLDTAMEEVPEWVIECNGKLWFNQLKKATL